VRKTHPKKKRKASELNSILIGNHNRRLVAEKVLLACENYFLKYFTYQEKAMPKSKALLRKKQYFFSTLFAKTFFVAVIVLVVIAGGVYANGWRLYKDGQNHLVFQKKIAIVGKLHFTALKPDPTDRGTVKLLVRPHGGDMWETTAVEIPLSQDASWQWEQALPGLTYDFTAQLVIDGKVHKNSQIVTDTAPSHAIELPLEVNWTDLPADVVSQSFTRLAGNVTINGYIPPKSVLEIYALKTPDAKNDIAEISPEALRTATKIVTINNPQSENAWTWEKAIPLKKYGLVAVLHTSAGTMIAPELVTADASEEALQHVINSSAQPLVHGATTEPMVSSQNGISGLVTLQGPKDRNTSLLMLWRKLGQTNYNVVNRYLYPANEGTNWMWNGAEAGQTYEITAALQVNNNNTSTAPIPARVTAPARNVNFDLNTYFVLPATTGKPSLQTCIDRNGSNDWTAIITVPVMPNAGNYWMQVGDAPDRIGNTYDQKFSADDNNQNFNVRVSHMNNGRQYFVRYSYSTCANCQNNNNFAPFSQTVAFTCQ
jgi:hypothetical protein